MTSTRRTADTVATVTEAPGTDNARTSTVSTFALGHWEKGALQVLLDGALGAFGSDAADRLAWSLQGTTLGEDVPAVQESLRHLASLVRGFSQADDVAVTATVRD